MKEMIFWHRVPTEAPFSAKRMQTVDRHTLYFHNSLSDSTFHFPFSIMSSQVEKQPLSGSRSLVASLGNDEKTEVTEHHF